MLCEKCGKNNATTHIHSVVNGVVSEINLCGKCAAEGGYAHVTKGGLVDMLASVFGEFSGSPSALSEEKCECCGVSFSDIAHSAKAGCPNCYQKFKKELLPYIKRVHGTIKHVGKKPNRAVMMVSPKDEITKLREKLNELILNENFEEAAIVRDEIKKVKEGNTDE